MGDASQWPALELALDIHARLCEGDAAAPSDLALAYLDPLAAWLQRGNPSLDPHFCDQAAEDAILSLIKNPRSFDPEKSPLDAYLRMSAKGDLRNVLERERRHSSRREDIAVVELFGTGGNLDQEENDPAVLTERGEDEQEAIMRAIPLDIEQTFSHEEQRVIALIVQGERRTEAFAQVLNISGLSEHEQRNTVKRIKDRIKRRMQRARGRR